jgi:ActR/RegA family two-component response regulator
MAFLCVLQLITLSLSRSDYMIGSEDDDTVNRATKKDNTFDQKAADSSNISLKQVEFNTISASFAGLAQNVSSYHR